MQKARNLFDAATGRGRVLRQADIVQFVMDGGGAVVVPAADFMQAQKWAQSRPATGNLLTDRARFLDQIPTLVSRPGSQQVTRGNDRQVERIVRSMRQGGYDIGEWVIPFEMKDPQYWIPKMEKKEGDPAPKVRPAKEAVADAADAAPLAAPASPEAGPT